MQVRGPRSLKTHHTKSKTGAIGDPINRPWSSKFEKNIYVVWTSINHHVWVGAGVLMVRLSNPEYATGSRLHWATFVTMFTFGVY